MFKSFLCEKLVSEYRIWSKMIYSDHMGNFELVHIHWTIKIGLMCHPLYYAKNSNDQPVIQRAEFLPSNKISPRVIFQIQIFKTYEFHKDSYASDARIQHNIIMFH